MLNQTDHLRAKLVSESAASMASASMSPPGATRNGVRLAYVIGYEKLRFSPVGGQFSPIFRNRL